jgi:DNA replication protein DnaC
MSPLGALLDPATAPDDGAPPVRLARVHRCVGCVEVEVTTSGAFCAACRPGAIRERREAHLRAARESIPAAFRGLRLGTKELSLRAPVPRNTLEEARVALAASRVVLLGPTSSGKTSLISAMLGEVIDAGLDEHATARGFERAKRARFVDALTLRKAVSEHALGAGEAPLLRAAMFASILVLDDVGQDLQLRTAMNPVVEVIRERHMQGRPTWITTFLARDEMTRAYDVSLMRRVYEDATEIAIGETA